MFIIEGSDNLGKTTAAKRMVELAAEYVHEHPFTKLLPGNLTETSYTYHSFPLYYTHMSRPCECFDFFNDYNDMSSKYAVQDRFHLGGLIWHKDKITPASLSIIEGRLLALGSMVCVFYASDKWWFEDRQRSDERKQMFDPNARWEANKKYMEMACKDHNPDTHVDIAYDVSQNGFPNDNVLKGWLSMWYERLALLPR